MKGFENYWNLDNSPEGGSRRFHGSMNREVRPCGGDSRPSLPSGLARHPFPLSQALAVCLKPPSPRVPHQWRRKERNLQWPLL